MSEVFISYDRGGESEEIANTLNQTFQEKGIKLIRDKTNLGYKDSLREFMQQIGQGKCIVAVIGDRYLKSKDRMFELLEISKNGDFYDRIFPIVLKDARIYDGRERLNYLRYWEDKIKELDEGMRGVILANIQGITEEIDLYTEIRAKIAGLAALLQDMNTLTVEMHKEADFREVVEAIEKRLSEDAKSPSSNKISGNLPSNLPYATSHFVGREDILRELHEELQQLQPNNQLAICAVSGMGGIGKTELAVQYALRYQNGYQGGLCWLQCRGADLGTQIVNYGPLLGLAIPEGLELPERVKYCWNHWPEGTALIIYDDVADYSAIAPYLPPSNKAQFKVLMTSRIRPNRASIKGIDLDVLEENAALDLLRSLVGDNEKLLEQKRIDREIEIAKQLCKWLGYLPLGLELVGSYLAQSEDMELKELWEELNDERLEAEALKGIEGELRTPLGVIKAFQLSWQSLSSEAQELGYRLSLFAAADIPWEMVERLFPESQYKSIRKIRDQQLLKFSLLQRTGDKSYRLHPLIREFFSAKQEEIENTDECKRDQCRVMVAVAKEIPSTVTLKVIGSVTPVIPHLKVVGENLMDWVEDKDVIWPNEGLGRVYKGQSAYSEAEKWYKQSVKVTLSRLGENHPDVASSYNNLALLYQSMGRYTEAEPMYHKSLEIGLEQLGENHPDVASSYNNLAELYRNMGRYTEAEPMYRTSLEIRLEQLGENHLDVATSYNNLAELYRNMGRYTEAEPMHRKSLEIMLEQLGENHPDVATSYNNLALLYDSMGRYTEAEPMHRKSLEIRLEQLGENHPDVATSYNNLALLYDSMGRYTEAEPMHRKSLEIRLEQLGENHPDVAQSYNNLAGLYRVMGRYEEAKPMYQKALEISLEQLGENHPDVATSYNNLALLYSSMGRYEEAMPYYQQALNIARQTLGEDHPNTKIFQNNYITMLMEAPEAEILKILPEENHEAYRQMRQEWASSQLQEGESG